MVVKTLRFSAVSPRRRQLIRISQALNFGCIRGIPLQAGEPFIEAAAMLVEERLDLREESRPEIGLDDFNLCQEWCRLFARFDEIQDGVIERVEVRAGIPRRPILNQRFDGELCRRHTRNGVGLAR